MKSTTDAPPPKDIIEIKGSDLFYKHLVGKLTRHYTVTCSLCHSSKHFIGQRYKIIKRLHEILWTLVQNEWFCPQHPLDEIKAVQSDPDRPRR